MEKHPKKLLFTNKRKYNQLYQGFAVSTVTSGLTAMNGRVKVPHSGNTITKRQLHVSTTNR